jgi:hypothetical protein
MALVEMAAQILAEVEGVLEEPPLDPVVLVDLVSSSSHTLHKYYLFFL